MHYAKSLLLRCSKALKFLTWPTLRRKMHETPSGSVRRGAAQWGKEEHMSGTAPRRSGERHETFIVRSVPPSVKSEERAEANVATLVLPDGKTVHALDREVFDRAVKEAFKK